MKKLILLFFCGLVTGVQAEEGIILSTVSNGVLRADGMEAGTAGIVEAVSSPGETFTNAASFFDAEYVADSNGVITIAVPMFFRVKEAPAYSVPEGMVEIPAGINSGTNPLGDGESDHPLDYPETYVLTNEFAFYMDATEVTKAQWDTAYNWATNNSYSFSNTGSGKGTNHPVHTVNWYDCVKWCNARSEMEGRTPCYTWSGTGITFKTGESPPDCDPDAGGYRLPTSGEWEYAARGGQPSRRFPWGDTITHNEANYESSSSHSYDISTTHGYHPDYDEGGYPYTSPVGSFPANVYGLYDMAGNVIEWSNDWRTGSAPDYYVVRGGSWYSTAPDVRIGRISSRNRSQGSSLLGFRSVLPAN